MNGFSSPDGFVMLIIAIALDVFGILCLVLDFIAGPKIGELVSGIPDIAGFIIFGFWSFIKSTQQPPTPKTAKKMKKTALKTASIQAEALKKKYGRWFFASFIGEIIPFVGALPFWTIYVYTALK